MNTWDILICAIPHRHQLLCGLLAELDRQMQPGVGVRVCRDNLQASYGDKNQALLESSTAEYISYIDDDDFVAPSYISTVMEALKEKPDFVGYLVRWTIDGIPQRRVEHSLRYGGWSETADRLARDISEKNPMRRDIAVHGRWEGGWAADNRWAIQLRETGLLRTEAWIDAEMYYYQDSRSDNFRSERKPLPENEIRPLPSYPWLTVLTMNPGTDDQSA